MLTGEIKNQVDKIWDAFWSGGISNPMEVLEQITYLLFLKRLDELHTLALRKATATGKPVERRIFPKGKDSIGEGMPYEQLRWSTFKDEASPAELYKIISEHAFPFLRSLGGEELAGEGGGPHRQSTDG